MKEPGMIKGALKFGTGAGISRVFGFIREIVFAHLFGATWRMDAFRVAFRIPNLLRDLLAEGTLTPAFVPVFSDRYSGRIGTGKSLPQCRVAPTEDFVRCISGTMLLISGGLTIIGIVFAPLWVKLIAFGFPAEKLLLTVKLTRIMFPFLIFITSFALVMGILNFFNHFFTTGIASFWFDLAIIGLGLALSPKLGILSIAIGSLLGGVLQLVSQFPMLAREKYLLLPRFKFNQDVKRVFLLMLPIALGYGASKINAIINTIIASFLEDGVIAWLSYGFRLMFVPVGVIGVAIANAMLPFASRELSEARLRDKSLGEFRETIKSSVLYGMLLGCVSALFLLIFAHPICKIIYEHGKFTPLDTIRTVSALKYYSIGIPGLILTKILATAFYALKNTKTPMYVSFITVAVNAVCAITLVRVIGFTGIPLAVSIANFANAGILGILLKKSLIVD